MSLLCKTLSLHPLKIPLHRRSERRLASFSDSDSVSLLKPASAYLHNQAGPKRNFSCGPFYFAADRFFNAVHAFLNNTWAFNRGVFLGDEFNGFLAPEVSLSCTFKAAAFQIFLNNMKLFGHDSGDRLTCIEQQTLDWLRCSIRHIKNEFLTSSTALPLQPTASGVALHASFDNITRKNQM